MSKQVENMTRIGAAMSTFVVRHGAFPGKLSGLVADDPQLEPSALVHPQFRAVDGSEPNTCYIYALPKEDAKDETIIVYPNAKAPKTGLHRPMMYVLLKSGKVVRLTPSEYEKRLRDQGIDYGALPDGNWPSVEVQVDGG